MRVLHVVGGLDRAGAETWLVQVLRHLNRQKYQFDFLVHSNHPGHYDDEVRKLGSRVIPCLRPDNPLRYAFNFRRVLKENGPYDCVHSHVHWFSGYVLCLAWAFGVPRRIAHIHTGGIPHKKRLTRALYEKSMSTLVHFAATEGIAVSSTAADEFFPDNWQTSRDRWTVQPIGIDLQEFSKDTNRLAIRNDLGIPPGSCVVGHVGRFVDSKNHAFLIDVVKRALVLNPHIIAILIGDGPLKGEMEGTVKRLGIAQNFRFLGIRPDVPVLLKGAIDVFIFPSKYEGFGLAVAEAQIAGLPCLVSSNVPDEACMSDSRVRRLPLSDGPEVWAEALCELLRYPPANPAEINDERFSLTSSIKSLTDIYDEVVNA